MSGRAVQYCILLVLTLFVAFAAIRTALIPPHLGVKLSPSVTIESDGGSMRIDALDLVLEPSEFSKYAEFERFFERQGAIYQIIADENIKVFSGSSLIDIASRPSKITDLHLLFWMQLLVGLGTVWMSGWVLIMRRQSLASVFFFLAGISLLAASGSAAIYTTRELALPADLFRTLTQINAFGGGSFGIPLTGLFLVFPLRLPYWRALFVAQALIFGGLLTLFLLRITWVNLNITIVIQVITLVTLMGVQFWRSQGHPAARATLTWLGLSCVFGAGAFVVFNSIPVILEINPLDQSYAFMFILILFMGVAASLTEFQLYHSRKWIFRLCVASVVVTSFILVDLGFLYVLRMGRGASMGLAFVVSLALFLPMREALAKFLYGRSRSGDREPREFS